MTVDQPVRFPGTPAQAAANRRTHHFGDEGRCYDCDCRPFGRYADYPCGAPVKRETVENGVDYLRAGARAYASAPEPSSSEIETMLDPDGEVIQ